MRVLYVVDQLATKGGIQSFARSTMDAMPHGIEVAIVDWRSPLSFIEKGLVYMTPTLISGGLYAKYLAKDFETLHTSSYDLVHFWHVKAAMSCIEKIRTPFVITCHGSEIMESNVSRFQKKLFIKALSNAARISADSTFTKQYIIDHYSIDELRIDIVHPGINIAPYQKRPVQKNKKIEIGTLTRLVPRKNVLNIITALNILAERGIAFNYTLAGIGQKSVQNEVMSALDAAAFDWKYEGRISENNKLKKFYPKLNVFVLPPRFIDGDVEGFGIVFLEANAHGIPVVASNTGGIPDAVKPGVSGVFADPEDPKDIANKILAVIQSKQDWQRRSHEWAEKFSQENTAKMFTLLYRKIHIKL